MKYNVKLVGITPYSPSKAFLSEKLPSESFTDFEKRCWKEHAHTNHEGQIIISSYALKGMLDSTASYLGEKYKGNSTYTKFFKGGIIIENSPLLLIDDKPISINDLTIEKFGEWVFCDSQGKKGGSSRVYRLFPKFDKWSVEFGLTTLDERITTDVLGRHLKTAGIANGIGRFRPQNAGDLGRFEVILDGKPL